MSDRVVFDFSCLTSRFFPVFLFSSRIQEVALGLDAN